MKLPGKCHINGLDKYPSIRQAVESNPRINPSTHAVVRCEFCGHVHIKSIKFRTGSSGRYKKFTKKVTS